MTGISIRNVHKKFGNKHVLEDVSLEVADGEFVCLLGPSGCGKSTLLRAIAGLESPDQGEISLADDIVFSSANQIDRAPENRNLGMVFQSFALWPHKTVFDNVAYPLKRAKESKTEIRKRVQESLEMVALWDFRDSYPGTLSGGQQQRVSLARAVVGKPRLLLLDEPLSSLDTNLRAQMRREIRKIQQHLKATAVYVTHDKEDAGGLADRVMVLQDGEIVQQGKPQDVFVEPKTAFVSEFVGFDNFFEGRVVEQSEGRATVELATGKQFPAVSPTEFMPGEVVTAAVRSRLLQVTGDRTNLQRNAFPGILTSKVHLGDDVELVVSDGSFEVVARVRPGQAKGLQIGQKVWAETPENGLVLVQGTRAQVGV